MTDKIGYGALIEDAMLNVVKGALRHISKNGLEGEHHFYITFLTTDTGVSIPKRLMDKHPQVMTIVLQNQFWNLTIEDDYFSVDLSFNKMQETLRVPFASIISFDDPSVQFSLHFNSTGEVEDEEELPVALLEDDENTTYNQDNVVSLSDFRKNTPEKE